MNMTGTWSRAVIMACLGSLATSSASKYAGEPLVRTEVAGRAETRVPTSAPASRPTTQEVAVKSPWMIREASLPAGFPAVGPVGEVIVKRYPAYRAARVTAAEVGASDSSMFNALFNHIKRNDIKMTAPVEMTYPDDGSGAAVDMAFLYGEQSWGKTGADGQVRVADLPEVTVLSIAIRGSYSEKHFREGLERLRKYAAERAGEWEVAGPPRVLGYNSPFVPWFMRMSEVQLPVRAKG